MVDCAIIFDVDGVLLELTREEEELFFQPFEKHCDASQLSRDWNSYRIRNDEDILNEICDRLGIQDRAEIKSEYLKLLRSAQIPSPRISGAAKLLDEFSKLATLGIATANFREAANLRLKRAELWQHVRGNAFGADGGGAKHEILDRALAGLALPKSRIVYMGDNINDVEAGLRHAVHFIGFSENMARLKTLAEAGATHLCSNHKQSSALIRKLLAL
jgi:phosphoglycolate phosphatase-like HAD superfamily hydrolase